jgi:hypothetical protein
MAQADTSHIEFMFATSLDKLADANHRELQFARMSEPRSEDYGHRSLIIQPFKRPSAKYEVDVACPDAQ